MTTPDRIEKTITLRASLSRVWQAISDSQEFGKWFGMSVEGPFIAGEKIVGKIRPTLVDPEVAKSQEPYTGKAFEITIESIEPERLFAFRWHPFALDPNIDYSKEPTTLVEFELTEVAGGTLVKITESGFDRIPLERRALAFRANDGGWSHQTKLLEKYVVAYAA